MSEARQEPPDREYSSVTTPLSGEPTAVRQSTNTICAAGQSSKPLIGPASSITARIYRNADVGSAPSDPPAQASDTLVRVVVPFSGANWRFIQEGGGANNEIPNALGNAQPAAP